MQAADVIGTGRLGRALGAWLGAAGWRLDTVVSRDGARARRLARRWGARHGLALRHYEGGSPLVFLAVPDDQLAGLAVALASGAGVWRSKVILHGSGALSAAVLAPLRGRGAAVGSLHPLMTFARGGVPSPAGVVCAIEGDPAARRLAGRLVAGWGGLPLPLRASQKTQYHLAAMFVSPLVVVDFALATEQLRRAGLGPAALRRAAAGLQRLLAQTAANLAPGNERALAAAWTGPLARGDRRTERRHRAVAGPAAPAYRALAAAAGRLLPPATKSAPGRGSSARNRQARPRAAGGW